MIETGRSQVSQMSMREVRGKRAEAAEKYMREGAWGRRRGRIPAAPRPDWREGERQGWYASYPSQ